eukprot:scaffold684_cov345-Pavlova_lutheri.AAC.26
MALLPLALPFPRALFCCQPCVVTRTNHTCSRGRPHTRTRVYLGRGVSSIGRRGRPGKGIRIHSNGIQRGGRQGPSTSSGCVCSIGGCGCRAGIRMGTGASCTQAFRSIQGKDTVLQAKLNQALQVRGPAIVHVSPRRAIAT